MERLASPRDPGGLPREPFAAAVRAALPSSRPSSGESLVCRCLVANRGAQPWDSNPPFPVQVAHRWFDLQTGRMAKMGPRARFERPLGPGEERELEVAVRAPLAEGDYVLRVSLVQEHVAWFDDVNPDSAAHLPVHVEARPGGMPLPPPPLAFRVAGTEDLDWFHRSGRRTALEIDAALAAIGRSLVQHRRILDFGCGCGRITRWLGDVAETAEIHAADIDGEAIAWAQAHIGHATFHCTAPLPPLPFPDGSFDLIYAHSVFTHLDETYQDAWLAELRRVLRPDGTAVLTVAGERVYESDRLGEKELLRKRWDETGFLYIDEDVWAGGPFPDFYHSARCAPWYVMRHWGAFFEIAAFVSHGALGRQDMVVCRKRPPEAGPAPTR